MAALRRHLKRLLSYVIVLVLLAVIVVVGLMVFESRLIFFPTRGHTATPEDFELEAEELALSSTDNVTVHGFYVTPVSQDEPRAHILLSHGNGGNLSGRLWLAKQLAQRRLAVLLYDYRGYGHSTDLFPTESGAYDDAETALAALLERAEDPNHVVLYGRSLGGGISYELASRHPELAGIITDATFTSVPEMVRDATILSPLAPLVRTRMDNLRRIGEVRMPKLILHGTDDQLVPFEMSERLRDAAIPPVEHVRLPGAGHNDTFRVDQELYFSAISSFVDRIVR